VVTGDGPSDWTTREKKARDAMDDLRILMEEQAEIRHHAIVEGMGQCDGSQAEVARRLGLSRQAIHKNLAQYSSKYGTERKNS
jgi:DNA-binding NtrC family response regulator